jgi:hypothetical protein
VTLAAALRSDRKLLPSGFLRVTWSLQASAK